MVKPEGEWNVAERRSFLMMGRGVRFELPGTLQASDSDTAAFRDSREIPRCQRNNSILHQGLVLWMTYGVYGTSVVFGKCRKPLIPVPAGTADFPPNRHRNPPFSAFSRLKLDQTKV